MNIHVIETVCQIAQQQQQACLITNSGPGTVYLGTASYVTPTGASLTLLPRQSVNWQGGALWGICEPGAYAELMILPGGNTTVSPVTSVEIDQPVSIDGPVEVNGTVGIDGPVTVEGTVTANVAGDVNVTGQVSIDGGVDINGTVPITGEVSIDGPINVDGDLNITAMDVTVSTQIAGDISLAGTPPINSVIPLFSGNPTIPIVSEDVRTFDVSHNQIVARIRDNGLGTGHPADSIDVNNYFSIYFVDTDFEYLYQIPTGAGDTYIYVPAMGKRVQFSYSNNGSGNAKPFLNYFATYLQAPIFTRYDVLRQPPIGNMGGSFTDKSILIDVGSQNTTARRVQLPTRNGRAQVTIAGLGTGSHTFQIGVPSSGGVMNYFYSNTALKSGTSFELIFPDQPCHLRYQLASGSTGFTMTINYL